ncbi:MAG: aminotransferase class IV [Balneolales bacterium]
MAGDEYVIQDGKIIQSDSAVIPAISSGACYGDGCFETWRSYSGSSSMAGRHLKRLKLSMSYLGMVIPANFTSAYFDEMTDRLLTQNGLKEDARIRLQVWRIGRLGYHTNASDVISYLLTSSPFNHNINPVHLKTVSMHRIPSVSLQSNFKLSNGLNYILARREAELAGFDDALMLDMRNHISETTIANIFWSKKNTIYTPSEHCDLLPGITREVFLEWMGQQDDLILESGEYTLGHVLQAERVWLTNSVQEIIPVAAINNTKFKTDNSWLNKLREAYREKIGHA